MKLRADILNNIRSVEPYVPGEQPQEKVIKLNTNENPYPPAPEVTAAIRKINTEKFRLYPDPTSGILVETLAEYHHVSSEQIFVGVGSDDVLSMCFLTFFNSGKPILFPDITYSFYKVWAGLYRIPYESPKLSEDFHIRVEDYKRENGGVIFPNPNAPTGIYEHLEIVEEILKSNRDVVVIVDEAYIDFAGKSAVDFIKKYDNLLVVRTFSKSRAMAGMRIGYAIGNPELIRCLNDVKYSFNSYTMSQAALVCGTASVKADVYFTETVNKIIETREWAKEKLKELGFEFPDAKANFIFVKHPEYDAKTLFEMLKSHGIYVRYWGSERIDQYLRITIGTREEMEQLFETLTIYMKENA